MRASKNARTFCPEQAALAERRRPLAQISPRDLDIAGLGQLPPTQLALHDYLEPGARLAA
jgi:hypothetical protein